MALDRYAVLVDKKEGRLCATVPHLRQLGFRVVTVPDAVDAKELVCGLSKLSLVVVNEELDPLQSRELLRTIRERHPHLTVLWHGRAEGLRRDDSAAVRSELARVEALLAHSETRRDSNVYSPELVQALSDASVASLQAFGARSSPGEPLVNASRTRLAELNALLRWSGPCSSGSLVVGCARATVGSVYATLFDGCAAPSDAELLDLLGEVANRIVGRMVEYSGEEKVGSFGLPLFITGVDSQVWERGRRTSLCLEFDGLAGRFFVELWGELERGAPPLKALPQELIEAGQFIVL